MRSGAEPVGAMFDAGRAYTPPFRLRVAGHIGSRPARRHPSTPHGLFARTRGAPSPRRPYIPG